MSVRKLILDAGGVLTRPRCGQWDIPVCARELLGDRFSLLYTENGLRARAEAASILREDVFIADMAEERDLRRAFLSRLNDRLNLQLSDFELAHLADDFTGNLSRYAWYPDVDAALARLHERLSIGILSDAMPSLAEAVLQHDVRRVFSEVVLSTQIGATKPNAVMYAAICERMGAEPGECLFIDDKICNLEGALRFGMCAVQMDREGGIPLWSGPVVRDFAGLEEYLEEEP